MAPPPPDDLSLINRHLAALRDELRELREVLERSTALAREATLAEVDLALGPVLEALARSEAGQAEAEEVVAELPEALARLGLQRQHRAGARLELWPEEACEDFTLDQPLSPRAAVVHVEVRASGWRRDYRKLVAPLAAVIEVVLEEETHGEEP